MKHKLPLRQRFWFCLLLNMVVCGLFVAVTFPFFEANDDQIIMHFIDGTMGYVNPHLVFQNTLLGYFLIGLYSVCRTVPWYTLLQYTGICLGFAGVTWVMQKRSEKPLRAWFINLFLWLYFGYECYTKIQFTKTAAIIGVSGLFVLYDALMPAGTDLWKLYREGTAETVEYTASSRYARKVKAGSALARLPYLQVIGGIALAFLGSLYRMWQFMPCAVITSGIGISLLFALKPYAPRLRFRLLGRYAAVMGLMFAVTIGVFLADRIASGLDDEWRYYKEYNDLRCEIFDYDLPDYAANSQTYAEAGIDSAAYELFRKQTIADPEVFSMDAMRRIAGLRSRKNFFDPGVLKGLFRDLLPQLPMIRTFFIFAAMFLIWLLSRRHRAADLVGASWSLLMYLACAYYMYVDGRYLKNRVDTGLWYALCLVFVWFILVQPASRFSWLKPFLIGSALFAVMVIHEEGAFKPIFRWSQEASVKQKSRQKSQEWMEKVTADTDHLYLAMLGTVSDAACSGPFTCLPEGYFSNVIWSGGWETYTARYNHALAQYGITNPFRDLVESDQIYLIAFKKNVGEVTQYLQRYGRNVKEEKVRSIRKKAGLNVYRFTQDES